MSSVDLGVGRLSLTSRFIVVGWLGVGVLGVGLYSLFFSSSWVLTGGVVGCFVSPLVWWCRSCVGAVGVFVLSPVLVPSSWSTEAGPFEEAAHTLVLSTEIIQVLKINGL